MRPILSLISNLKFGSNRMLRSSFENLTPAVLESRISPVLLPILKKTPAAFLSVAFVFLAACNFDPLWFTHDAETEVITIPQEPGQLQTCNSAQQKASRERALARNQTIRNQINRRSTSLKTLSAAADPCISSVELSALALHRPLTDELPLATAPPKSLI